MMYNPLKLIVMLFSVHVLWACADSVDASAEAALSEPSKEILVVFGPNAWGDDGYNDLIYKGLLSYINETRTEDVRVNYYNPASLDEAKGIISTWKNRPAGDRKRLLVLVSSTYEDVVEAEFRDHPLDTSRQTVLMFESKDMNMPGVCSFNINLYGTSFIAGAVASKMKYDPIVVMANSRDSLTNRARDGFIDGYVETGDNNAMIEEVYLSDSDAGYAMADSTYMMMFDWTQRHNFIFSVIGGSNKGVFRYIRESRDIYTIGVDVDQSRFCGNIVGSMVKHIDVALKTYLEKWAAGEALPRNATYGLKDGYTEWVASSIDLGEYGIMLDEIKARAIIKENVFVKPDEQSGACFNSAVARKRRMKSNVFVKPDEQSGACSSYAVARKRRMKSKDKIQCL